MTNKNGYQLSIIFSLKYYYIILKYYYYYYLILFSDYFLYDNRYHTTHILYY